MKKNTSHKYKIYFAAALFSGRETLFNVEIATKLENKGHEVILPQRDGFEFANLAGMLKDELAPHEIPLAVQTIIYLLDIGIFLPQCEIVLANLDEPIDEGVVVEMCYGRMMDKFTIGYRTDVRSPYGSIAEPLRGIHFFPALQCNVFLSHFMSSKSTSEANSEMQQLTNKIIQAIEQDYFVVSGTYCSAASRIVEYARCLFGNIIDIHSKKHLRDIVQRYCSQKDVFANVFPLLI